MWIPKSEQEIVNVATGGNLEEGSTFDAKRELPSNNKETAKDIAAMANDGGVIIYGLGEDDGGRPTILSPISLAGQRERIESIARTAIQEPVDVQCQTIATDEDPAKGYLVVVIPPSERAPHMVTVGKTNRFYGRKGSQNVPLTEGDVARLYERRQRWEMNREALLEAEIERAPIEPHEELAYLHAFARPVSGTGDLLLQAAGKEENISEVLHGCLQQATAKSLYPRKFAPTFTTAFAFEYRAEGLLARFHWPHDMENTKDLARTLSLQIDFNGTGHLFCGRAADTFTGTKTLYMDTIAGNTVRFLAFLGHLYEQANYVGKVDVGVGVTNAQGVVGKLDIFRQPVHHPYDQPDFRKTGRFSALRLRSDPGSVAQALLKRLFDAVSQKRLDPFRE